MWLLNTSNLELDEFSSSDVPAYAILSHTWGQKEDEISFRDMRKNREAMKLKAGYGKVEKCCQEAAADGYSHVWIDTCCIDKRSSAELSEAINSMYKWYQNAKVCYVYLVDFPSSVSSSFTENDDDGFAQSRWFTRAWTLQELIASRYIEFFRHDWTFIGTKGGHPEVSQDSIKRTSSEKRFLRRLVEITGIEKRVLQDPTKIIKTNVACRMSWASRREASREEDIAYALMGLFGVNMPILYGEGQQKAFKRLQFEIIKSSPDQSIFAWRGDRESSGLFAESPHDFARSGPILCWNPLAAKGPTVLPHMMTNIGLNITLPLQEIESSPGADHVLAALRCWIKEDGVSRRVQLHLKRIARPSSARRGRPIYRRVHCNVLVLAEQDEKRPREDIYVLEEEQFTHIELIDGIFSTEDNNE